MNERVTVEVDAETLKRAREAGLDLSDLLARALRRELPPPPRSDEERKRIADQWYAENKEAVDASNEYIEKHGLWSDGARMF
jgi:antitoxin CcdA